MYKGQIGELLASNKTGYLSNNTGYFRPSEGVWEWVDSSAVSYKVSYILKFNVQ